MKAGFYVYWYAVTEDGPSLRLLVGPFIEWGEADKIGPRVVAHIAAEEPYAAGLPGVSYGICRLEGPILPPGPRNAALWVSPALLVP